MRRRQVVALLALSASAWPLASRAQAGIKRVGVVYQGGPYEVSIEGLREGLRAAGLEEGRDIALLLRNVRGDAAASEAAARSLERDENVHVIVAIGTTTALAAQRGTKEVPIVFAAGSDPITAGLVASIAKPGGRLTGFHLMINDLTAKRLEILREIVPKLRRVIAFYNPRNRLALTSFQATQAAARKFGIEVAAQQVANSEEVHERLRALRAGDADAFFFVGDLLVIVHTALILEAARTLRLPTMAIEATAVRAGALVAYGPDFREYGRLPASYVARILASSLPRDLPVEAINRPALTINLKTATALGLTIPPEILLRADEVIE